MSTRPTAGPTFAKGGGNPSTWPTALEANGYPAEAEVPAEDYNGMWENHGDWLDHLERGGQFADLATALANTAAGESFRVTPAGLPYEAGDLRSGISTDELDAVALDAAQFYMAFNLGGSDGVLKAYDIGVADVTADDQNWSSTLTGYRATKVVSNGTYVAYITDSATTDSMFVHNATTGAVVYALDHGAAVHDIAITDDFVIVVGVADGVDDAVKVMDLSDGSVEEFSWGTSLDVYTVSAVENEAWVIGAEADGSGNDVGRISSTGGGAVGADWRAIATRTIAPGARSCSNGRFVFIHNGDTGAYLTAFSAADGSEVWEKNISATLPSLVCDVKDLYLVTNDVDPMYVIDPHTGGTVAILADPFGVSATQRTPLAANSHMVVRGGVHTGPEAAVQFYASGVRARIWHRAEGLPPHFNQAQPEVV